MQHNQSTRADILKQLEGKLAAIHTTAPPPQLQPQAEWLRTSAEVDGLRASDENEAGDDGTAVEADAYPGVESKAAAKAPALAP